MLELHKMFDINQEDSTSRAQNMPIQTIVRVFPLNPKLEKPEKFDGTEFNKWMLFYLTTLYLAKFMQEDPPESKTDWDSVLAIDAWTQDNLFCRNYILNVLAQRPSTLVLMMINSCSYVY